MLKWEVHGPEEEPVKLPKIFNKLTILLIIAAVSFVFYLWHRWMSLLLQNHQTLLFWLKS